MATHVNIDFGSRAIKVVVVEGSAKRHRLTHYCERQLPFIRVRYGSADRGIGALREIYDGIIRRAEAEASSTGDALREQERIEIDDTRALMARRAGVGRKVKFHDRCRKQREALRFQVEEARTRTESLPIIGILGTIFGLVVASLGQDSIAAMTGGIWIALLSSLFALSFMLVAKYRWEAAVLSHLENLEDRESLVYEYVALREDAEIRAGEPVT